MNALRTALVAACVCTHTALGAQPASPVAGLWPPTPAAAAQPRAVAAPHFGDTLFRFYQGQHFDALTSLMVSQHFGRIAPHDDEAEVLRGGMLLSWGQHQQAAELFARLIERNAPPAVRDRAWFYLARISHQRALPEAAQAALARIESPLPGALEDERRLLQAQLMMGRGDYAAAATVLQTVQGDRTEALYARFNLGVALVRSGDAKAGTALLDALGQVDGPDEEVRALRDRANVALGFAALQAGEPRDARAALQRVRLNGPLANKALLGYGWAAAGLHDPQLALDPWRELAQRPLDDAAVLEAHIAVPYAMTEIGAYSQALTRYQETVQVFDAERQRLEASIAATRTGRLVRALLASNALADSAAAFASGTLARIEKSPELPHLAHLAPLLADHPFQEAFRNLRDLRLLDANLARWRVSLDAYGDVLDARARAFAQRLPEVRARAKAADQPALQARHDALAAELARARAQGDAERFATTGQRDLLERVRRARAVASRPEATIEVTDADERLRRASGALTWQLAQDMPARAELAVRGLGETGAALVAARARDAALLAAQQAEPARREHMHSRLGELESRLQALVPRVAELDAATQAQMQGIVLAELARQQERLDVYVAQAHLAIAQIHDRSQLVRDTTAGATGAKAVP